MAPRAMLLAVLALATSVATVLLGVELARILAGPPAVAAVVPRAQSGGGGTADGGPATTDGSSSAILERPLFSASRRQPRRPVLEAEREAPPPRPMSRLIGFVERQGAVTAILADDGGTTTFAGAGAEVEPGWILQRIGDRQVVLQGPGGLVVLDMASGLEPGAAARPDRPTVAPKGKAGQGAAPPAAASRPARQEPRKP